MYWLGLKQGDIHLNISSPGWAKHAWSNFFAPWNAQATVFIYNYSRFDAPKMLNTIGRCGVTSLCAPPTVWRMFIQEDLAAFKTSLRELIGAGEPLNPEVIEQVEKAWNITIRDGFGQTETTAQIGNSPGQQLKAGSMGRPCTRRSSPYRVDERLFWRYTTNSRCHGGRLLPYGRCRKH